MRLLTAPHPTLLQRAEPVTAFDHHLSELVYGMVQVLEREKALGLAAPQVGALLRVIVVRTPQGPLPIVNPTIVYARGRAVLEEGCLSLPGVTGVVPERARKVRVEGYDVQGKPVSLVAEGLLAVCIQHETDHLDGVLFTSKVRR